MAALDPAPGPDAVDDAWNRVAALKPRLAAHAHKVKHSYRGETWYVLTDRMTANHFRCTPAVERFLSLLDGRHSIAEAHAHCSASPGQQMPTREEVLRLLAELQSAKLLLGDMPASGLSSYEQQRNRSTRAWLRKLASPLALQIPLLDPDELLQRLLPWFRPLFSRPCLWLWCAVVTLAALAAAAQWPALQLHWESRFLAPSNLLYLWLLYPLVKGLHELGHGLATGHWGGEVHEMGIMLLVFTPVPYVDASASSAFEHRYQRIVVAAAGIMVELLLSALALWGWIYSDPGLLRDLLFNVLVIGGVSTLLFNGNPLLRFDGYYVLSDALEIPNLRARSGQALGGIFLRVILGTGEPGGARGAERAWLLTYAILSGIYRLFISFTIALFIAGKYFFAGATLALWLLASQVALPFYRALSRLWQEARRQGRVWRAGTLCTGGFLGLAVALFAVPMPDSDHAQGVITLPQDAQVRSRADGFVQAIFERPGQRVSPGDPLLELQNLELQARESVLQARARELAARHDEALSAEPLEREIIREELAALDEELDDVRSQLANLVVRSPQSGTFHLPRARDLPGRFVRKGDTLGHVIAGSGFSVRVVVPQSVIEQVRSRTQAIEVRLVSDLAAVIQGGAITEVPLATSELPSALLGSRAGGSIAVDARDQGGRQALSSIFQLDVNLPMQAAPYLGQRAFVRFIYRHEPLGTGWYRRLRQLFLTRLSV